jgi:hypothetical protein
MPAGGAVHSINTGCRQLCANSTLEIVAMQRKQTPANPSLLSYRPRNATTAAPQKAEMGLTSPKGQKLPFQSPAELGVSSPER